MIEKMGGGGGSRSRSVRSGRLGAALALVVACLAAGCSATRFKVEIDAQEISPDEARTLFVYFVPADEVDKREYADYSTKKIANNTGLHQLARKDLFFLRDVHSGDQRPIEKTVPSGVWRILVWGIFEGYDPREDIERNPDSAAAKKPVKIDPSKMSGGFLSSTVKAKIRVTKKGISPPVYE